MNWNAFKRLFHYLGRYKLRLILVMIAAVLSTLFTVLTPAVTGGITSELYDGVASGSFDWETIVWLLVTLIALYLVARLLRLGNDRLAARDADSPLSCGPAFRHSPKLQHD